MMKSTTSNLDTVVIGGGVSGLATAYRLQQAGLNVLLLEKQDRLGGSILSEQRDGFLVDYGPNSTLETSPDIKAFVDELGLAESRLYANESANRRYVVRDSVLCALPMSPPQFLKSELFSLRAKLRLMREPFIKPALADKEETIAEFVTRRLGQEFLDYAINPFVAGVYAGDPARLSVRSAVSKIYALEKNYGSLIKGAIRGARQRKKRRDVDKTRARLFSFKEGMFELIAALSTALAESVQTGVVVQKITRSETGWQIHVENAGQRLRIESRSVVTTTPAFATATWLEPLAPPLASGLRAITYPPVAMVFLGFAKPVTCRPLDGFGFLVPQVENKKILGTIWSSTLFANRAPDDGVALTTFVGGMRQPELAMLNDDELQALVTSELADLLALRAKPDFVAIKRWLQAIPQYELQHQKKLDAVSDFEAANPGFFISGNFRGGISVGDCILRSAEMADSVMHFCKHRRAQSIVS
jgi:oxygen-dependent protoporphyrinogen oxidase